MTNTVVVDAALATEVGRRASRHVIQVGEIRRPRRWRRRPPAVDDIVEVLDQAPHPVIALLRITEDGSEGIVLRRAVDAVGAVRIALPCDAAAARWCVAIAAEIAPADHHAVVRALEVLCNGPDVVGSAPRRVWGAEGVEVPALRPVTLARWASCAWTPCSWCTRGGADAHPCLRCGAPVRRPAPEEG